MPADRARTASAPAVDVPRWVSLGSLLLALGGLAVSAYLTVEHYTTTVPLACPETGPINCYQVTTSEQSRLFGVPVALLGLLYFVAMVAITLPVAWRLPWPWLRQVRLALAGLGVLFVIYLIYAELFIIDKICLWCTAVHVITFALFAVVALGTAAGSDGGGSAPARRTTG